MTANTLLAMLQRLDKEEDLDNVTVNSGDAESDTVTLTYDSDGTLTLLNIWP